MSTTTSGDFVLGDFPTCIDNSMRTSFANCEEKFRFEYIEHYVHPQESIHLHAGKCFAAGLEKVRNLFYRDHLPIDDAIREGALHLISEWGDYACEADHNKRLERMVEGLGDYFREYPPYTDHVQPYKDVSGQPMIEFSFAEPLDIKHPQTGEPILYTGRFDMVGLYNQGCYAVDDKTTGQLGAAWLKNWHLRSQFTGYTWALQQQGLDCRGVIVRGQSFLKSKFGHAEVLELRANWEIDRWYEQLYHEIQRMIEAWERKRYFLNLDQACASYGGCSFQKLCQTKDPDQWASTEYIRRRWNPVTGEREDI